MHSSILSAKAVVTMSRVNLNQLRSTLNIKMSAKMFATASMKNIIQYISPIDKDIYNEHIQIRIETYLNHISASYFARRDIPVQSLLTYSMMFQNELSDVDKNISLSLEVLGSVI